MRVKHLRYHKRGQPSRGVERIVNKLAEYAPGNVQFVDSEADLYIVHVTGRHDHVAADVKGKNYVICQYVLQSCRNPDPLDWLDIWKDARFLWSYYDLRQHIPDMYLSPLGADSNIFYPEQGIEKVYALGTLGIAYKAECVGECQLALHETRQRGVHIGPNFNSNPIIDYRSNLSDDEMRQTYNQCQWFGVLRRGDGFEMPGAEALLCGVRPIMFDTPNFRQWYGDLAEFIPENNPVQVVDSLKGILRQDRPVTEQEIKIAKKRFDWETIMTGFWERVENA